MSVRDGLTGRVLAWAEGRRMLVGGAALLLAVLAVASVLAIGGGDSDDDTDLTNTGSPTTDDVSSGTTDVTEAPGVEAGGVEAGEVDVAAVSSAFRTQTSEAPAARPASGSTSTTSRGPAASAGGSVSRPTRPLYITQAGWAQAPTSQHGWVPPEGLPAALQGGSVDRYSFFRLDGTGTSLKLNLMSRESPLNDGAGVAVCPITSESWKASNGQPMERAPGYDSLNCVLGKKVDKSVYSFDLSRFPVRTGGNGFALIPRGAVGATFEVVFDRTSAG